MIRPNFKVRYFILMLLASGITNSSNAADDFLQNPFPNNASSTEGLGSWGASDLLIAEGILVLVSGIAAAEPEFMGFSGLIALPFIYHDFQQDPDISDTENIFLTSLVAGLSIYNLTVDTDDTDEEDIFLTNLIFYNLIWIWESPPPPRYAASTGSYLGLRANQKGTPIFEWNYRF